MPIMSRWLSLLSHNVSLGLDQLIVAIQWDIWHNDDVRCYLKRTLFQRNDGYHTMYYYSTMHIFMPPPLDARGIMFSGSPSVRPSVCPSVQSLKYPLLTCTWVRWSTRPTVTVLRHVRPSVRPERFPGICWRMHAGIGLKFYMLMYLYHLQNWLVYGHGLLIFLILALFWLSETGQIWGVRAFPGECMEGMAWNFARWCILTTFRTD